MSNLKKFEVKFDYYVDGVKSEKKLYATKFFGGEVLAENKEKANLTVREWLCDDIKGHDVKMIKSKIFVDGNLLYSNFKANLLVA